MSDRFVGHSPGNAGKLPPVHAAHVSTDEAGRFVSCAFVSEGINQVSTTFDDPATLVRAFVTFSHRGHELLLYQADHDMRYLIPALEQLAVEGYEITFTLDGRQRVIFCKIALDKHRWYIRDVSAMLPLELEELRVLCDAPPNAPTEAVVLRAYRAFAASLRDTFGVRPSVSIGATAMNAWTTTLPEHHIYYRQRQEVEELARDGYFGGLVWLNTQKEQGACTYIDVNAMYAHAMRQGVPVQSPTFTDRYYPGYPGIYYCRVFCPLSVPFSFVPARDGEGIGIVYPRNAWYETVVCSHTIELAREVGYQIEVIEGYVFEQLGAPFGEFIDRCEELEQQHKGTGTGYVIKSLRNSLYGKFGQRQTGHEYCLSTDEDTMIDDGWQQVLTWDGELIDCLWQREVWIERGYLQPVWAAWITATARNTLARMVYALGAKSCIYGDTDSIIVLDTAFGVRQDQVPFGPRYGEWKLVERFDSFRAIAPKLYAAQTRRGEWRVIASGIKRGMLSGEAVARLLPDGPPVLTERYRQERRAIHTVGGRAMYEDTVKQIVVPELHNPMWDIELAPG